MQGQGTEEGLEREKPGQVAVDDLSIDEGPRYDHKSNTIMRLVCSKQKPAMVLLLWSYRGRSSLDK